MNQVLFAFLQQATPEVVAYIQGLYHARHPTQPPPTSDEVLSHWDEVRSKSLAKDDSFRAEGS